MQFDKSITPNFHRIANQFVTLDNFMDPGDGSMDGWSWSLQGRVTNTETITQQINYAFVNRGLSYESEGMNRNVPVNFATTEERDQAAGPAGTTNYTTATASLPGGTANVLHRDGESCVFRCAAGGAGWLHLRRRPARRWHGSQLRLPGQQRRLRRTIAAPVSDPFAAGIVQVAPLTPSLVPVTDVYFRGYDQVYPDLWRYNEWKREFDQFVAAATCPTCRWCVSATTTWAPSRRRWLA